MGKLADMSEIWISQYLIIFVIGHTDTLAQCWTLYLVIVDSIVYGTL